MTCLDINAGWPGGPTRHLRPEVQDAHMTTIRDCHQKQPSCGLSGEHYYYNPYAAVKITLLT